MHGRLVPSQPQCGWLVVCINKMNKFEQKAEQFACLPSVYFMKSIIIFLVFVIASLGIPIFLFSQEIEKIPITYLSKKADLFLGIPSNKTPDTVSQYINKSFKQKGYNLITEEQYREQLRVTIETTLFKEIIEKNGENVNVEQIFINSTKLPTIVNHLELNYKLFVLDSLKDRAEFFSWQIHPNPFPDINKHKPSKQYIDAEYLAATSIFEVLDFFIDAITTENALDLKQGQAPEKKKKKKEKNNPTPQ
jgi:hypothetical protein